MTDGPWKMYAARDRHHEGGFVNFGHPEYVRMCGWTDPVPVTVTEDPDGTYYGWMGAAYAHYTADTEPCMIQPHKILFDVQFPYLPEAEEERGHGRIVRLTITERTEDA